MVPHGLRQRAVAQLSIEHRFELGVPARNRVADNHHLDAVGDVRRIVAGECANMFRFQKGAHRRIDIRVGALNVASLPLQQRRKRGHCRAANTDQMNFHATLASSITSRGALCAITRAVTPNGSVIDGPDVWPDGNPNITGPAKPLNRSASVSRA